MSVDVVLLIPVLILMAFGTFAAVLPVVPGPALVWFGAMIYAIATGFQIGAVPLILLTLLMIIGSTTNWWMAAFGVKATGGSAWGILGGMIGSLIGLVVLFPIGALIGAGVGAVGVELLRTRDVRKSLQIGGGTVGGFLLGVLAEFAVAGIMDIVFLISLAVSHRAV